MESSLKSLYQLLKAKGLIHNFPHPEYEDEPAEPEVLEVPAQSPEVVDKNKKEFNEFKRTLSDGDLANFNTIFGE